MRHLHGKPPTAGGFLLDACARAGNSGQGGGRAGSRNHILDPRGGDAIDDAIYFARDEAAKTL